MKRTPSFWSQVWTVAAKELTILFRIPAVVIFTLCLPLFIYTPALLGAILFDLWEQEKAEYVVGVPAGHSLELEEISSIVDASPRLRALRVTSLEKGLSSLNSKTLDALFYVSEEPRTLKLYFHPERKRSKNASSFISDALRRKQSKLLLEQLSEAQGSPSQVPLKISFNDVNNKAESSHKEQMTSQLVKIIIFVVVFLILLESRISTAYPAVTILASEREKNTILTTLSLPVSYARLLTGKCLAALLIAFSPIVWNAATLIFVFCILTMFLQFEQGALVSKVLTMLAAQAPIVIPAILLDNWLSAVFYFVLCCFSRSVSETSMLVFLGSTFLMLLLIVPVIPSVQLNIVTAMIPFLNMPLVVRAAGYGELEVVPVVISFAVTLLFILLGTKLVASLLTSDAIHSAERSPLLHYISSRRHSRRST